MADQHIGEGVAVRVAEETREPLQPLAFGRQDLRLLVVDHLQPVFDHAQETIGRLHGVARVGLDPAIGDQLVEGGERVAIAQGKVAAAGDQLLGLGEELDLADAATADLDVVALDRDLAVAAIGVDLPLHGLHVGDRGEIEILAPHERRKLGEQRLAGRDVAGARPRLDHGGALPVLPDALVVGQRRRLRHRDRRRGRIGAQAQVGAEDVAIAGARLQQLHQPLRQPHEQRPRLDARGKRRRFRVVEDDEIDVAGIVELERAHLAERQHDVAAVDFRGGRIGRGKLAGARGFLEQEAHGGADGGVGEIGERARTAHDRPDAADIGERDQERGFGFHLPQMPAGVVEVVRTAGGLAVRREQRGEMFFRLGVHHPQQALRDRE